MDGVVTPKTTGVFRGGGTEAFNGGKHQFKELDHHVLVSRRSARIIRHDCELEHEVKRQEEGPESDEPCFHIRHVGSLHRSGFYIELEQRSTILGS